MRVKQVHKDRENACRPRARLVGRMVFHQRQKRRTARGQISHIQPTGFAGAGNGRHHRVPHTDDCADAFLMHVLVPHEFPQCAARFGHCVAFKAAGTRRISHEHGGNGLPDTRGVRGELVSVRCLVSVNEFAQKND